MKDFKLTDLEGIGPTKAKRLENNGITSPMDFVIRGAKEISRITDITKETALKLVHDIKSQMVADGTPILINSIKTLRELKKIQKKYPLNV